MGWCSVSTEIFDVVAGFVLSTDKPDKEKFDVLQSLATVLKNEDWDCMSASHYLNDPIVRDVYKSLGWDYDE